MGRRRDTQSDNKFAANPTTVTTVPITLIILLFLPIKHYLLSIIVVGFISYKLGVDSGKKQYQKTMIRLARKNGEIWRIVDRDHRLTVTYF